MKTFKKVLFLLSVACSGMLLSCSGSKHEKRLSDSATTVEVESGLLAGYFNGDRSVRIYKGIPYALPPVGELRWKAPQPAAHWDGVFEATEFGCSAMQKSIDPIVGDLIRKALKLPEDTVSEKAPECNEDCLYLNVWAPASGDKHPVLVWIHGGSLTSGSGAERMYDGEAAAKAGVVMVTFNYRLGVFGYLAHPQLSDETVYGGSGNYGLMDQLAAVKWVSRNIERFGGDPDNITIAGESAGSYSVSALCASPEASGLFDKAIAESGTLIVKDTPTGLLSLAKAEERGKQFFERMKVNQIDDLRKLPADELNKADFEPQMTVDGYLLPDTAYNICRQGKQNDVSLLIGYNSDEGKMFTGFMPMDLKKYKEALEGYGEEKAGKLWQLFPATTDEEAKQQFNRLFGGLVFGYPAYVWTKIQHQTCQSPVYQYYFSFGPEGDFCGIHAAEISYAYNNPNSSFFQWTEKDYEFSKKMFSYWMNFVKTGNPNGEGLPEWKPYNGADCQVLELGKEIRMIPDPFHSLYKVLEE